MERAGAPFKKRKREPEGTVVEQPLQVQVDDGPTPREPVLASFMSTEPPTSTRFALYALSSAPGADSSFASFVHNVTTTIELGSTNQKAGSELRYTSQYFVGLYDKTSYSLRIRPAPVHSISEEITGMPSSQKTERLSHDWWTSRKALGIAFGNAASRKAIRDAEARQIDARAVRSTINALQTGLGRAASALPAPANDPEPSNDALQRIPPYNSSAITAEDAYPLHKTVTIKDLEALDIGSLDALAGTQGGIHLPYRSKWAISLLSRMKDPLKLRILLYICYLMGFRQYMQHFRTHDEIEEKLAAIPTTVLRDFQSRFTLTSRDSQRMQMTPDMTIKIINHILVLCLRVEDWEMDVSPQLTEDLRLDDKSITAHFRSLGCQVVTRKPLAKDLQGLSAEASRSLKVAKLKLPLRFLDQMANVGHRERR